MQAPSGIGQKRNQGGRFLWLLGNGRVLSEDSLNVLERAGAIQEDLRLGPFDVEFQRRHGNVEKLAKSDSGNSRGSLPVRPADPAGIGAFTGKIQGGVRRSNGLRSLGNIMAVKRLPIVLKRLENPRTRFGRHDAGPEIQAFEIKHAQPPIRAVINRLRRGFRSRRRGCQREEQGDGKHSVHRLGQSFPYAFSLNAIWDPNGELAVGLPRSLPPSGLPNILECAIVSASKAE